MSEQDERAGDAPREETEGKAVSRARFVKGAGAVAAIAAAGGTAGAAKASRNAHLAKRALAPGKIGGPTGFKGAERYQYGAASAEGRAIQGLRRMTSNGKKPITLSMLIWSGAIGHWNVPYPNKAAPTAAQLLEQEAGIKLKFVPVDPAQNYQKNLQAASTRSGSWNIVQVGVRDNGDLAEAGLLLNLDPYVAKYKPDWNDPKLGYVGGKTTTSLMNMYNGSYYSVSLDGDYQVWVYRLDLFENKKNKADFKAKYGRDLRFPSTWDEHAQVAEFFTRPDQKLYGSTDLKNPFWGYSNWMQRYVSSAYPNQMYFDPATAKPLVDSPAGVRATKEHVASLAWTYPDALSKSWPEQYANLGAGGAAMSCTFSNVTKFITKGSPLDKGVGQNLRTVLSPGRNVGGRLVRRSILPFNAQYGVNAFADKKTHEAAYLVLQWASAAHVFTWMVGNPAGYYDPNKSFSLNDPTVRASYKPYAADMLKTIIPRTAPEISGMRGANEYLQALDINLQKALSKQISPEAAMKNTAAAWEKITNRIGRDKQIKALKAQLSAWPKQ